MSTKILSLKKTRDFTEINKNGCKFFVKDLIIIKYQNSQPNHKLSNHNIINYDNNHQNKLSKSYLDNKKKDLINCRIGFTVSKSVSKLSTSRNLIKRRIREAVKKNYELLQNDCDYVFIARKSILESSYIDIERNISFALKKLFKLNPLYS